MTRSIQSIVAFLSMLLAGIAFGQTTTPSGFVISSSVVGGGNNGMFSVSGAASPAGAGLIDAATYSLNVDTTSDILLFDVRTVVSIGTLFNPNPLGLGSDTNPPNPAILPVAPELEADTFYTTPNVTSAAGTGVIDSIGGLVTHFDTIDDGPQTGFNFGQVTLLPDANGVARARVIGTMQTANEPTPVFDDFEFTLLIGESEAMDVPGCTSVGATNFDPFATVDDGSCVFPPDPDTNFSNVVQDNGGGLFVIMEILRDGSLFLGSPAAADDPAVFPDGLTIFAPNNDSLSELLNLDDVNSGVLDFSLFDATGLIFAPGLSATELNDLGDLSTLTALNGSAYELENGLTLGGANIISSHEADNGWVHILDAVPVAIPEPGALPLVMLAGLFALNAGRRRRR